MTNTTNPTTPTEAAAQVTADYTKVVGAEATFDIVEAKHQETRRVKMMTKLEPVIVGIDQSLRDNQIGIARLNEELKAKHDKVAYVEAKKAELKALITSGAVASITDLNNFMAKTENARLAKTVGYVV